MIPTTREQFKEYCLRKLGDEVIDIEISDNQAEDRIDEAIKWWTDFNVDGTERQFYAYELQAQDLANQYITLPSNIVGVVSIIPPGDAWNMTNIFNVRYQIALNDLYTLTSVSMAPYYMAFSHVQLLEQLLVGQKPIRYNRISNRLYLDMDWTAYEMGQFLIVDAYQVIDPGTYPAMWGDRALQNLATALMKVQWAQHLQKYTQIQLAGGNMFSGVELYRQAREELKEAEATFREMYDMTPQFEVG